MTGRSPRAAGAAGRARAELAAASFANAALTDLGATSGRTASAAPFTCETNSRTCSLGQAFLGVVRTTQGFLKFLLGNRSTADPRVPRVNSSPEPLHSGLLKFKVGQNPRLTALAKVSLGAWASTA